MNIGEVLLSGLLQVLFWVGSIILTGVIIRLLNRLFYRLVGTNSYKVCLATGCIGTPIHEIGHAFFCLVFGHKIVEIKLFKPEKEKGTIGYVKHTWNDKNLYQKAGLFFIGVGPIIFGSALLLLLLFLFVRPAFESLTAAMASISAGNYTFGQYFTQIGSGFGGFFATFFSGQTVTTWTWWVMFILGCLLSIHMNLSPEDIQGAKLGLLLVIAVFALVPIIVGIISSLVGSSAHLVMTGAMTSAAIYVMCVYALAIIFSSFTVVIAFVIRMIVNLFKKIFHRG